MAGLLTNDVDKSRMLMVLIPVFNDWDAVKVVVQRLSDVFQLNHIHARIMLIDDGSTIPAPIGFLNPMIPEVIEVLRLRRNLGHQRAIAIAMAYVHENISCHAVAIMDGDGEDDPNDVPRLLEKLNREGGKKLIFAERAKRSEGFIFRSCYVLYRYIHLLLTGIHVRVGNFSVIPLFAIDSLVVTSELWNHYAAAVFKARLPVDMIPVHRAHRVCGQSKMNFVSLVVHGLSAISVFGEKVGVRLLIASSIMIVVFLLLLVAVLGVRVFTLLAIPGWATSAVGLILVVLFQMMIMSIIFIFITLNGRQGTNFLPIRDYSYFISSLKKVE